jgi:hypothetical protein
MVRHGRGDEYGSALSVYHDRTVRGCGKSLEVEIPQLHRWDVRHFLVRWCTIGLAERGIAAMLALRSPYPTLPASVASLSIAATILP